MILLDTHAWVWWVSEPRRLSRAARKAVDDADIIGVSAISVWEIATKVTNGKLRLDRPVDEWSLQALAINQRVRELVIDARVAVMAGTLGTRGVHGDPADRILIATAKAHGCALVTKDEALRQSKLIRTIW